MDNFTQEKEIIYLPEIDDFEHPLQIKITLGFFSIFTIVTLIVINRRLFMFLRRPNRRILDQIVDFQYTITQVIAVLTIIFFNIIVWTKVARPYVTEVGCYVGSFMFYFLAPYANAHSFFIALFRYICIIHPNKLSRFGLSPEVRGLFFLIQNKIRLMQIKLIFVQKFGRIIVLLELVFALIATLILWIPTGPENSSFIFNCLGKDDIIYFKYDYFTPGGYSRKRKFCMFDNIIGRYLCQGYLVVLALMTANIFEIFLTSAVMMEMSKSTASVAKILSGKSLVERKR